MSRKLRIKYPGAICHIMNRGSGARAFFPMMLVVSSSSRTWLRLARRPVFGIKAKQAPGSRETSAVPSPLWMGRGFPE